MGFRQILNAYEYVDLLDDRILQLQDDACARTTELGLDWFHVRRRIGPPDLDGYRSVAWYVDD